MLNKSKKLISILACASIFTTSISVSDNLFSFIQIQKVRASTVKSRSYGIDVSAYQSANVSTGAKAGAQFAIVKVSEGTGYRNPKASAQISSARSNGLMPLAYHFALFGANYAQAKSEAKYAVSSAKASGLAKGAYIACDWENGDGNNVNGSKQTNTGAIITFLKQIHKSGYKPLLYSGASLLNNNISTSEVISAYPNSLWVASYTTMGRIDNPDFNYFPSLNGVIIWQFTDNWRGLNVDGNISLLPLRSTSNSTKSQAPSNKAISNKKKVMSKSYGYSKSGERNGKVYSAYKKVRVYGGVISINKKSYYRVGNNSYIKVANVDGIKRVLKSNAVIYNRKGKLVATAPIVAGITVPTYGGKRFINNKKYYRINKNRYIMVDNFK